MCSVKQNLANRQPPTPGQRQRHGLVVCIPVLDKYKSCLDASNTAATLGTWPVMLDHYSRAAALGGLAWLPPLLLQSSLPPGNVSADFSLAHPPCNLAAGMLETACGRQIKLRLRQDRSWCGNLAGGRVEGQPEARMS